jgi:hypothetical protein
VNMNQDILLSSSKRAARPTELHLALSTEVFDELTDILFPVDALPHSERGVIGIVHPSVGRRRRTLLLRTIVPPQPGDVVFDPDQGLFFSPQYKSRATDQAASEGGGVCFLHTHPVLPRMEHVFPAPSSQDLASDRHDLFVLGSTLRGAPLVAGIISDAGLWSVREYVFSFPRTKEEVEERSFRAEAGLVTYASAIRVVGPGITKLPTSVNAHGPSGAVGKIATDAQDSSVCLWGEAGQQRLASLRVGHTGTGGVGSILAEHTARFGIGESLFLDYDQLNTDNFNRSQGATRSEASKGVFKATVAERVARASATAPHFDAQTVIGSVVEASSIKDLLDCDIILNGADSAWARQILDHLAFAHLIPVINGGTILKGDLLSGRLLAGKSEISVAGPGHPCFECSGVYSLEDVTEAQESPTARGRRRYIETGDPATEPRAPSVIGFNALVSGLIQLRLVALTLGATPQATVGTQRYHVLEGVLEWSPRRECSESCKRRTTIGLGDSHRLPTGRDLDLEHIKARLTNRATG